MHPDDDITSPQALVDELRASDRQTPVLTARADRTIEALANAQFAGRRRPLWQSRPAWAAAAASVLVAFLVVQSQFTAHDSAVDAMYDVDGSGQTDIVDVLALARRGDGISQAELAAFAYRLVSLSVAEDET